MSHSYSPGILSSSSYPIPEPVDMDKGAMNVAADSVVFLGGLSLKHDDEAEQINSKKSGSRTSTRKRGRPRLLNKDDNAAERRRTQIRLAQRAYRSRKEATISSLNDRITEIDAAVESLARSFASFHDKLINSELLDSHPDLLRSLRNVAGKTASLAQLSKREALFSGKMSKAEKAESGMSKTESQPVWASRDHCAAGASIVTDEEVIEYLASSAAANTSSRNKSSKRALDHSYVEQVKGPHATQRGSLYKPHPYALYQQPASVPHVTTNTFAHRLHRVCIERGYQLLLDPFADPEILFRAFRFSFGSTSRERLIARFYRTLIQGTAVPESRDGHGGIPFPTRTQSSNLTPPQIPKSAGSWPMQLAQTVYSQRSMDGHPDYPGFDGEWLDANDVEDLLREQGIAVDARSSFVDISNMPSDFFHKIMTSGSFQETGFTRPISDNYSANTTVVTRDQNDIIDPRIFTLDSSSNYVPDANPMVSMGDSSFSTPDGGSATPLSNSGIMADDTIMNSGFTNGFENISLTFDVKRFLDRLVVKAVCLGWTPGYRKADVEDSLYHAVRFII